MNEWDNINRLKTIMHDRTRRAIPKQVYWGTVDTVDWGKKTCTVIGLRDTLDFYEVLLGLGSHYTKPVKGTKCLIGVLENEDTKTVLLACEEIEREIWMDQTGFKVDLNNGQMTINGDEFSGIVKAPELKAQLDKMTARIDGVINAIKSAATATDNSGSTYKTNMSALLDALTDKEDFDSIENETIKHGA